MEVKLGLNHPLYSRHGHTFFHPNSAFQRECHCPSVSVRMQCTEAGEPAVTV